MATPLTPGEQAMIDHDHVSGASFGPGYPATPEPVPVSALREGIPSAARKLRGTVFWVPEQTATTPANGDCIVDHWWSVHPEHGLAFYAQLTGYAASESPSPQCNQSEGTAKMLGERLWPDHEVRKVPVVFMAHADRAMRKLKAQAIEARRAETRSGSVHESAVGNADAPNPHQESHQ